ncbi:MAG: hypothetical protein AB1489_30760, partial [Acidobacteriota bacterium]
MKRTVTMSTEYRCPFCPDHKDEVFVNNILFDKPICEACDIELNYFCKKDEKQSALLIDLVEQYTGKSWNSCRIILIKNAIQEL